MATGGALAMGCATADFSCGAGAGWRQAPLKGPTLKQMEKPLMSLQGKWYKADTRHTHASTGNHNTYAHMR